MRNSWVLFLVVSLGLATSGHARDIRSYRCDVSPTVSRNKDTTPKWIALEVNFFSGDAVVSMPGIDGKGTLVSEGRVKRDTDELFSITWRALVGIGYYRPSSVLDHRITIQKATNTGRYRSENIRGKGNVAGTVRCKRS